MRKLILLCVLLVVGYTVSAQFPTTDSLRNYNTRYTTNSAINWFTNLRGQTLLRGMIDWIDSARLGISGSVGVDTVFTINDSTLRYKKNGSYYNVLIRGNGSGGTGTTDLDTSRSATQVLITSSTGTDAYLFLVDKGSNKAGLMSPTDKGRLDSLYSGTITDSLSVSSAGAGYSLYYISVDTLKLKRIQEGTNVTFTINADSSISINATGGGGSQTLAQVLATGRTLPTNDSVGLSGKYFKFYGNTSNVQTEGLYLGKRQFDNATNAGWYPLVFEPMSTDSRAPNWYWKLNQTVQTGTYPNNVMKMGWNPDLIQTNKMALWDAFESYYSPGGGTDSILERHFSIQGPGFGEVRLGSWTAYIRNGVLGENNTTNLFSNFDLRAETFNIYTTTNRTYASFSQNKTSRVAAFQLQSGNGTAFNLQVDSSQGLITFSQSGSPTPRVIDFFRDGNTRDVNMYGLKVSTLFGTQFEGYAGPDGDSTREFGGYSTKFKRGYFGTVGSIRQVVGHLGAWGNFTPSNELINWTPYADDTNNFLKMYGVGGSGTKFTVQNNGAIGSATKSGYLTAIDLSESNTDTLLWPRWGQVLQKLAAVGGTTLYTGDGSVSGSRTVTLGTNTFTFSSNSLNKFHIASNGKVSIGSTTNNGYDFNVNGQLGVTGSGFDFAINGSSSFYWGTTGDNNVRWVGNSKEFRQIISSSDISFSPYTDNTLPYRIKDFGGTTRFEVDFATPQIALTARLKLNGTRAATSNDVKLLVKGESDSTVAALDFPIVQTSYTPTRGDITNIASASVTTSYYQRTGNKIEVWGEITIDPTATGDTQITLSLPIASSMSNSYDLSGSAAAYDVNQSARIYYSGGVAVVRLNAGDASSHVYSYRYVYYYFAP